MDDRFWNVGSGDWDLAYSVEASRLTQKSIFCSWLSGVVLLGLGTGLVYPTLLAAIGDVVHPGWRASAVGVYRLWRDLGYAVGALLSGIIADLFGVAGP